MALVRNRDQCHQIHTVAVPGRRHSKLTQLVNLSGLHSPVQLLLNALLVCMHHMSKTILLSKKAAGTGGLPQLITVIGAIVVQGIAVTTYPILLLLSHSLSTHALHECTVLLNLLLDHTRRVIGITSPL